MMTFRITARLVIWMTLVAALATAAVARPARVPMHLRPLDATQPVESVPLTLSAPINFEARIFKDANSGEIPYRLLRPLNEQDPNQAKYPLVLVLHGLGERGNDNIIQLRQGVADVFVNRMNRAKFPAFVVVPQCPSTAKWVDVDWRKDAHAMSPTPSEPIQRVIALLDALRKELPVDPDRIYVTGMAQGGFGVWDIIARRPDLFAAAIPVSGGGDENIAARIKGVAVWAYHGEKDYVVKPDWSQRMVTAIQKAGGTAKFTLTPDIGYEGLWRKVFDEDTVALEWMFAQSKLQAASQPASQPASAPH